MDSLRSTAVLVGRAFLRLRLVVLPTKPPCYAGYFMDASGSSVSDLTKVRRRR